MNDVTKRFIETYKSLGLTGYRMGKQSSVITKQKISNIENGVTEVSSEILSDFFSNYSEVNPDYILTGDGKMLRENGCHEMELSASGIGNDTVRNAYITYLLPLSAMGGSLTGFGVNGVILQNCEAIVSPIENVDFAITVYGESMVPEYPSGSRILIKKINPDIFIDWGKAYVLDTPNGVIVKEVHRCCDKEGCVRCHSLNPDPKYSDFDVPLSEIYGIYRVLMCLSAK